MSARPGPLNLITDVEGLSVGQKEDAAVRTGCTVILADRPAVTAVDVRGGGPGTRETDLLAADTLVEAVDALVLSGGSVYGLGAADGVAAWLGAQGRGFQYRPKPGVPPSPIVPAAILYDLANGGEKGWGEDPPYRALGRAAATSAVREFALGTAGAGYGAMAGALKGGLGSASVVSDDGYTVGALVAVNSLGSVVAPGGYAFWAGAYEIGDEFGGLGPPARAAGPEEWGLVKADPTLRENTTIAVVAVDAALSPSQARRLAVMAQNGLSRAIRPVHTPFEGDVVFALSTGRRPLAEPAAFTLLRLGSLAADTLARAVARGVHAATPWPGVQVPVWSDLARPHLSD